MKSISYAESSWLVGDDAADALLEYAVLLARTGSADSVILNALTPEGSPHEITVVLGPATMMASAESDLAAEEPDNTDAVMHIRERMRIITSPPKAVPATDLTGDLLWDDLA